MSEHVKVFLALAAIIGGLVCLSYFGVILATVIMVASDYVSLAVIGVLLLAGGITYFWMKGRSHDN